MAVDMRVRERGDVVMYVDFNAVAPGHHDIDARLINWARWANNKTGPSVSPMFRLYRSTEARQLYGEMASIAVDALDAARIQKAMANIPERHRHALAWCYIKRVNPRGAAQALGASLGGLLQLITDARQMLLNLKA